MSDLVRIVENQADARLTARSAIGLRSIHTQAGGCSLPRRGGTSWHVEAILIILLVGAIAGWLAGLIVRGMGFGLIGNIVVGIVGAFIAAWLLPRIGIVIGGGIVASIINATIGAVVLLVILGLIRRA